MLNTALKCVNDLRVIMTPFLPFSSQRLHEMLGCEGVLAPQPDVRNLEEASGREHRVLAGIYAVENLWQPSELLAGRRLPEPKALFKKLDEKVVEEELARLGATD